MSRTLSQGTTGKNTIFQSQLKHLSMCTKAKRRKIQADKHIPPKLHTTLHLSTVKRRNFHRG